MSKINKKEYYKYNNPEAKDMLDVPINIGDTVVVNNYYYNKPIIGTVDHFTESGKLAILYKWKEHKSCEPIYLSYRKPYNVVKLKDGNQTTNKDKE